MTRLSKVQIVKECEKRPREIFWILSKNGFTNAKILFGTKLIEFAEFNLLGPEYIKGEVKAYQYHLTKTLFSQEPIKYLKVWVSNIINDN